MPSTMRAQVIYVLCQNPLVVTGSFASYTAMSKVRRPFVFLYHNPGFISFRSIPRYLKLLHCFSPQAKIHFITNEECENLWLRILGQKTACLGQNLHVRDQFFVPSNIPKRYDAIYTAAMVPRKRIELAREIQRLCFVTYAHGEKSWDLHKYEPRLKHAAFNREFLSQEEVRSCYQHARVGLALSAVEGAMWACAEYLLCGLPVVTTPNHGGRNRYLDPAWSKTVPPNPKAIRQAVESFITHPPNPQAIRSGVLTKIHRDRRAFIAILAQYEGTASSNYEAEIERIWGGVEGIEKFAVPLVKMPDLYPRIF